MELKAIVSINPDFKPNVPGYPLLIKYSCEFFLLEEFEEIFTLEYQAIFKKFGHLNYSESYKKIEEKLNIMLGMFVAMDRIVFLEAVDLTNVTKSYPNNYNRTFPLRSLTDVIVILEEMLIKNKIAAKAKAEEGKNDEV
jgi:hypothetical protein